jgi:hypothetical protein
MQRRPRARPLALKDFSKYYASAWGSFVSAVEQNARLDALARILGTRVEIAEHARATYLRLKGESDAGSKSSDSRRT